MGIAIAVKHMFAAGMTKEQVMAYIAEEEADQAAVEDVTSGAAIRQRRYRAKRNALRNNHNGDVTVDAKEKVSHTLPKENYIYNTLPSLSNRPSRAEGTNPRALGTNPRAKPAPWMPFFEQFWEIFPRRVGKGSAKKSFKNAANRASYAEILDGARRYAKESLGRETQYIKHPSTWLNADCWLDEPENKAKSNVVQGSFRKEFKPDAPPPEFTPEEKARRLALVDQLKQSLKAIPKR